MAIEGGNVASIDVNNVVTGTGLAEQIAAAILAQNIRYAPAGVDGVMARAARVAAKNFGNLLGPPIINYLLANAEVVVSIKTTDAGLQRTPNPNNPNTPTLGPSADVSLTGELT
jgi:hypothetical protein